MKKTLYLLTAALLVCACGGTADPEPGPGTDTTVAVKTVTLNTNSLTLEVGASGTLTATVNPADATSQSVSWSSSNQAVAKVDKNGVVKAVTKGNATITARAGGKTAVCQVVVTEHQIGGDTEEYTNENNDW